MTTELTPEEAKFAHQELRNELAYEATMIVQRTAWFVAAHAFLFTAIGVTIDKSRDGFTLRSSLLWPHIPLVGMALCVVLFGSIVAAKTCADNARTQRDALAVKFPALKSARPDRPRWTLIWGMAPAFVLPLAFLAVWIALLLREHSN